MKITSSEQLEEGKFYRDNEGGILLVIRKTPRLKYRHYLENDYGDYEIIESTEKEMEAFLQELGLEGPLSDQEAMRALP